MSADSAAPAIGPKLVRNGALDFGAQTRSRAGRRNSRPLNWKSYRWSMSTVWLETVLTKQPARWLPSGYADYQQLLVAAVENALKQPEVPADVSQWKWAISIP